VAEKDLDRDRIAEQRLVNRDGLHNHVLNGRGARIIDDRTVECWMNDQSIGSLCRSRHHIRVPARTGASVRTNPIIVSRPWLQSRFQPDPGLVRRGTGLQWCGGSDVLLRRIDVLSATVGLRQREWNSADGEK